jgi:sugar (pentulose or hexulose) kinase
MKVVTATRELIERLLPHAPDCTGLVMCGQMSSLVITEPDGTPISNCISWRDERVLTPRPSGNGSYYDELLSRITGEERSHMGNELRPGLPISHLFWRAQTGQLPPPGSIPASLPDFVLSQLRGGPVVTEITHACSHGNYRLGEHANRFSEHAQKCCLWQQRGDSYSAVQRH